MAHVHVHSNNNLVHVVNLDTSMIVSWSVLQYCNSKYRQLFSKGLQEDFPERLNTVLDMPASLSEMASSHDQTCVSSALRFDRHDVKWLQPAYSMD